MTFSATYVQDGEWWVAWVDEIPGAHTQGATLDEARSNLREVVQMMLEVNRERAAQDVQGRQAIHEPLTLTAA